MVSGSVMACSGQEGCQADLKEGSQQSLVLLNKLEAREQLPKAIPMARSSTTVFSGRFWIQLDPGAA